MKPTMNEDVLETAAAELECLRWLRGGRRPVLMLGPFDSLRQWVRCKIGGDSTTALVRKCEALKSPWWISGVFTFTDPVMRRLRKVQCVCQCACVCCCSCCSSSDKPQSKLFFLGVDALAQPIHPFLEAKHRAIT